MQVNTKVGLELCAAFRILSDAEVTILSERRVFNPYGLQGGEDGQCGRNILIRDGEEHPLAGKVTVLTREDDVIQIETPGGGGYGKVNKNGR